LAEKGENTFGRGHDRVRKLELKKASSKWKDKNM